MGAASGNTVGFQCKAASIPNIRKLFLLGCLQLGWNPELSCCMHALGALGGRIIPPQKHFSRHLLWNHAPCRHLLASCSYPTLAFDALLDMEHSWALLTFAVPCCAVLWCGVLCCGMLWCAVLRCGVLLQLAGHPPPA